MALLYLLALIIVALVALVITRYQRSRRLKTGQQPPAGFSPTDEIFTDPTTGVRQRVWYNDATGERWYEPTNDPRP
ncbi:hypothetical protein [Sulfobacillus harzensis]|uniref:Uncharacterized protein n=1 Tax=Sulfobacillus harzensis TaxID=2729629 RepID=A0A7Y0L7C4_9FIRM|nr:hypothetical protein [Sulfobacillus harzensis]NMP23760.1 hypothetical protein [Sulfobacillus harzensis]